MKFLPLLFTIFGAIFASSIAVSFLGFSFCFPFLFCSTMPGISPARHIAIVGGGIIGSSSLYYLSQQATSTPLRLTLIEESPHIAPAASGKSGGFLAEDWHGAETADLAKLSYRLHRELAQRDGGAQKWSYREVETYSIGFDDNAKETRSKCPPELDWIEGKHVKSASNMGGGGTTAQVTPLKLVEHLVAQSSEQNKNVKIMLNTRAERVEVNESGHINRLIVKDKDGVEQTLDVDDVVVAAGPWTGKVIQSMLPSHVKRPSFYRRASRITGSRAHSIVVQSPKPTTAHCLFTDMHYKSFAGAPEIYARPDGTIYACGGSDNVPLPASAARVTHDPEATSKLIEEVAHLSPSHLDAKAGATVSIQQACYLPVANGGPVIAGDKSLGLYVAAGHSCWGITNSLGTGKVLSEMIMDLPLSADVNSLC